MDMNELQERLETIVDRVLSTRRSLHVPAQALTAHRRAHQERFLKAVSLLSRTSVELAYQFCMFAIPALSVLEAQQWDGWVLHLLERYDQGGVLASIVAMQKVQEYQHACAHVGIGVTFGQVANILERFLCGLSARQFRFAPADVPFTDTETMYLPGRIARFEGSEDNYRLYKAIAAHLWAQTACGTWRPSLTQATRRFQDSARAVRLFHSMETLRLDAWSECAFPGLHREMARLRSLANQQPLDGLWMRVAERLSRRHASVWDSYDLLPEVYRHETEPQPVCYQGVLLPERTEEVRRLRLDRERRALQTALFEMQKERNKGSPAWSTIDPRDAPQQPLSVAKIADPNAADGFRFQLQLHGEPAPLREDVHRLLHSILLDLGDLPPEYLIAAGHGAYRVRDQSSVEKPRLYSGHNDGHTYTHDEWDYVRKGYRREWCTVRERLVHPQGTEFVEQTLRKYRALLKQLLRSFEALRGDDKRVRRQPEGDDVDVDALVESYVDVFRGAEVTDKLFSKMCRVDRHVAVMFMVDMSGSTKGWINDIERESLVLLCACLEIRETATPSTAFLALLISAVSYLGSKTLMNLIKKMFKDALAAYGLKTTPVWGRQFATSLKCYLERMHEPVCSLRSPMVDPTTKTVTAASMV